MRGGGVRSGPPPDPSSLRQQGEWIDLPAEGRDGPTPSWPLEGQTSREAELWQREWWRPQAIMWERYGQELEVALYVRRLTQAEQPDSPVNAGNLVRQMQEALGISMPGLQRHRWRIVDGDKAEEQRPRQRSSARERLKVVG